MAELINNAGDPVQLYRHRTASGHVLAQAHLHSESTLNALSLDMIDILRPAIESWRTDDEVVALVFTAAGDRAFSAGGDVQALYHAMVRNHEVTDEFYPIGELEMIETLQHELNETRTQMMNHRKRFQRNRSPGQVLAYGGGTTQSCSEDERL